MTFFRIRIPPHYGTIYAYYGIIILSLALQKDETLLLPSPILMFSHKSASPAGEHSFTSRS